MPLHPQVMQRQGVSKMKKHDNKKSNTTELGTEQAEQQSVKRYLQMMKRREFMRAAMLGSVGFGSLGYLGKYGPGHLAKIISGGLGGDSLTSLNAMDILRDALSFGASLLPISQAMAQGNSAAPAVYRVFYQTSHDSRNELYLMDQGNQYNPMSTLNFGNRTNQLQGMTQASDIPILNQWAYEIMTTGKMYGTMAFTGVADKPPLTADEIAKISVIGSVGMAGTAGVHRNGNIPGVGSLEYAMLQAYQGYSPIGSVSLNNPIIDAGGGVNAAPTSVQNFISAVDVPAVYMSREQKNNPVRALDDLTGNKQVKAVRDQMLDAHKLLTDQLENIKTYATMAGQTFAEYGQREMAGLASMMMFADLFETGLATIGSVGMKSFDFHATDALRSPNRANGNMVTETAQAMAGVFHIAKAAFAAKRDAIVHFTTCSNRNANWVNDDGHVSTITFVIKGAEDSKMAGLSQSLAIFPDNMQQVYAEGPGNGRPTYSGNDAEEIKLTGVVTVGRVEATIVSAAGKIIDQTPAVPVEEPAGKLT